MQLIKRQAAENIKSWLRLSKPKVLMILGARQVGKTTLIKNSFIGKRTKYLNLDIEVDKQSFLRSASLAPRSAISSFSDPEVLIIDEAQTVPESGQIIKGWYDSKLPVKFIVSGSSSLNLLDRSAENLTGRNIKLYLPPLLFQKYYIFKTGEFQLKISKELNFIKNK